MSEAIRESAGRRVRPWIAALLTLIGGWGLGLFYARRTRAALWAALANVVVGIALGSAIFAYMIVMRRIPTGFLHPDRLGLVEAISWGLSALVAIWVWAYVSKTQHVERGSPLRLFGYLAIWLLPILATLIVAMGVRFFALQPFRMPSGSMQPTLSAGDYFVVSKSSYGYSRYSFAPFEQLLPNGRWNGRQPRRGDLVVFRPVPEPDRDFIKRLIGLPGDRIQMINGALYINGEAVRREPISDIAVREGGNELVFHAWRETLSNGVSFTTLDRDPSGELDNTRVFVVPEGHYFMLGDDRDNSADSRVPSVVGYVPYDNLIGRVDFVLPIETP